MTPLFDAAFPRGHDYLSISWDEVIHPLVLVEIIERIRPVLPEAVDVIAGLLHRLDSREIALRHICSMGDTDAGMS